MINNQKLSIFDRKNKDKRRILTEKFNKHIAGLDKL
jgi:hypothetical protein